MIYYNEFDKYPSQWLRNLIAAGHLPDGVVDERDIREVQAHEVPDTAHFFAGIGGWPLALKLAGWEGPVWTGSCPCQPFSTAPHGKQQGDDLWPAWAALIRECKPPVVFGEQVANGRWWDRAATDLDSLDYSCWAAITCASAVGFPRRRRLYFVAFSDGDLQCDGSIYAQAQVIQAATRLARQNWFDLRRVGSPSDGVPSRVGRLRAYGNAVVVPQAVEFVKAYMDINDLKIAEKQG